MSQTEAVNGLRLPGSCLLDVTFSPYCLGAIQVTLPKLHIDRFMILCNTAEPEMNYRDLSTDHLPAFPHVLSLTACFYPPVSHFIATSYSFTTFLPSFYTVFYFYHSAVLSFRAVGGRGGNLISFCSFILSCLHLCAPSFLAQLFEAHTFS